jgi:putative transposase
MSTSYPSDLTDAEWECVQRYLPALPRRGRPRTHPLRRIPDAIFYVLRTGCAWRYLPINIPPWQTVFYHFRRFRIKNTLHALYPAHHPRRPAARRPEFGPQRGRHGQPECEDGRGIGGHPRL